MNNFRELPLLVIFLWLVITVFVTKATWPPQRPCEPGIEFLPAIKFWCKVLATPCRLSLQTKDTEQHFLFDTGGSIV